MTVFAIYIHMGKCEKQLLESTVDSDKELEVSRKEMVVLDIS
jgi:hypothetical protein